MFRKSLKSISIMFRYAPGLTVLKLFQIGISAVLAPLSIFFTQRIIDTVSGIIINGDNWNGIIPWVALLLFAMFFSSVGGGFLNGILYISIRRKLNIGMTPDVVEKFKRLDYACFEDKDVQDTLQRMSTDPQDKVFQLFLTILGVLECMIGVIGAALIFSQAGWWFVVGFAALLVPMIWLDFKAANMMNIMFNEQSTDERKMHYLGGLLSNKSSLFELKIFRATDYIAKKWRGIAHTVMDTRVKTTLHAQKYFLISTILFKCWSFFVVLSLVTTVVSGNITIGIFIALIASTGAVLDNADTLSHTVQNMRQRYLLMEHYYKFLSLPEINAHGEPLTDAPLHIVFENVVFTYPKTDIKILNGVSFEVKQGERVALVGENGAGKSTIIKLLCRLYKPDNGRILINDIDIQTVDAAALRRVFSVVFQDFCKYTLTLRENIAFGDLTKLNDDNALHDALKMGLADGITELDTPLGKLEETGVDISGGQWQRVAMARACLPDSAFVILDEPTASLDPVAESNMYHSFAEVLKSRGCIMISHRLASARMADKIVVLSEGIVTETGGHEDLMSASGLYARMYESQSAWYVKGVAEA
ncbi:MAG: ABC transporter ATP-binding protein/permease [Clostridiales bacterium]|nr:ABC transporter ATP-binding protein/permease [Clostridiales bacterium]